MADIGFVLVIVGFFGLSVLYVRACDRLVRAGDPADTQVDAEVGS